MIGHTWIEVKTVGKLREKKTNSVCRTGDRGGKRGGTYGGILLSSSNEQRMNRCPAEARGEKMHHDAKEGGSELGERETREIYLYKRVCFHYGYNVFSQIYTVGDSL